MKIQIIEKIIIAHPRAILLIVCLMSAVFAIGTKDLTFDASTDNLLPDDNPAVDYFNKFRETFGNDETLVIAVHNQGKTVYDTETLNRIKNITGQLAALSGVEEVLSLSNAPTVRYLFNVPQLVTAYDAYPKNKAGIEGFKSEMTRLVSGVLVSEDGKVATIYVHPKGVVEGELNSQQLVYEIESLLQKHPGDYYTVGSPKIKHGLIEAAKHDTLVAMIVTIILVAVVLAFIFRDIWAVLVPLATFGLAMLWLTGFMGLLNIAINSWTSLVAPLVLVIAIADAVHILATYKQGCGAGDRLASVRQSLEQNLAPCALTSMTTILGFLSLTLGDIPVMKLFGICAAFGVFAAFVISVTFVPALLLVAPKVSTRLCQPDKRVNLSSAWLKCVIKRSPNRVIGLFVLFIVIFVVGMTKVSTNTNFLNLFNEDHPVSVANRFVENKFGGTGQLEIIVEGEDGQMLTVEVLRKVEVFQNRLEQFDLVQKTFSIVNLVKTGNMYLNQGNATHFVIPDNQATVDSFVYLAKMSEQSKGLYKLLTKDLSKTRIIVRLQTLGTTELQQLIDQVKNEILTSFTGGVSARVTGTSAVFAEATEHLVNSQIRSFIGACATILIAIVIVFRSVLVGLFCVVPNILPIISVFGLMGWIGVNLDFFNVMIASIAIGIAVDDTIHFMSRFQHEIRRGKPVVEAGLNTLRKVETAIITTSLILGLGFIGIALSASLSGTLRFGLLTSVAIFVALATTLVGLPALLMRCWKSSLRESRPSLPAMESECEGR